MAGLPVLDAKAPAPADSSNFWVVIGLPTN